MDHPRRSMDPKWISLRRHTTQLRISRIKALMPHREDFYPPNESSSWSLRFQWGWNAPYPSIISTAATCYRLISDEEKNRKIYTLLVVSRFQSLHALEPITKHPQNRARNLENCDFRYIQIAGNSSCYIKWFCSHRIMHFGNNFNTNTGHPDRDLSHVHPVSPNSLSNYVHFLRNMGLL